MNPKDRFWAGELNRFTLPVARCFEMVNPWEALAAFLALYGLQNAPAYGCTRAGNWQKSPPATSCNAARGQLLQAKELARRTEEYIMGEYMN